MGLTELPTPLKDPQRDSDPRFVPRYALSLLTLLVALLMAAPAAQAASTGPCVPGTQRPVCHFWMAKTTFVADGDTIYARVDGASHTNTIRFIGINAMELTRYSSKASKRRGFCQGVAATNLIERYIKRAHGRVMLAAQHPGSKTGKRGRLRRSVFVKSGGEWVDLARLEMEAGLALWLPNPVEYAHNGEYHLLAEQAAAAKRGLYNPASCGAGPSAGADVRVRLKWDADGTDGSNLNDEWVRLDNLSAAPVSLAGWWLRDSWLDYSPGHLPGYAFPGWAVIPAGGSLTLHMGCGADTPSDLHWCRRSAVYDNVTHDAKQMGDGAYIFDPRGNLRYSSMYPCMIACADPAQGALQVRVHASTPEVIDVTNTSPTPIALDGYLVRLHVRGNPDSAAWNYPFARTDVLAPGQTMQIHPGGSPGRNSALDRYLGRGDYVLADGGGAISLRTFSDIVVDCASWGRGRC
jgi:micrococcal nuclease